MPRHGHIHPATVRDFTDWYGTGPTIWERTRVSCLLRALEKEHSFVPRLAGRVHTPGAPEETAATTERHGYIDGRPRYVTALASRTDARGGWRENKPACGILMHVDPTRVVSPVGPVRCRNAKRSVRQKSLWC